MKNHILFYLSIFCLAAPGAFAQGKLIFRHGIQRIVIKPGKEIGVTQKGETYKYTNWNSACAGCYVPECMDSLYARPRYFDSLYFYQRDCIDTLCVNNIWTLDSVKENEIVLRRWSHDPAKTRLDTVRQEDMNRYRRSIEKQYKEAPLYEIDSATGAPTVVNGCYVMLVMTDYDRKTIPIDSLSSVTFSRADRCSTFGLGVPLMAAVFAFASPIAAANKKDFNGKYGWPVLVAGEAVAGWLTLSMVRNVKSLKVRTYNVDEWKVKMRS
jgi:hypothetical protein